MPKSHLNGALYNGELMVSRYGLGVNAETGSVSREAGEDAGILLLRQSKIGQTPQNSGMYYEVCSGTTF